MARSPHARNTPPRTASPLVRAIFNEMVEQGIRLEDMAGVVNRHKNRLSEYRRGQVEPKIMVLEEMAQALGGRIVFVKDAVG